MKVLFIAYYFDPFPGVGAKRISYWARNIHKHFENDSDFKSSVVTATRQTEIYDGCEVYFVQDNSKSFLSRIFKTDRGASWLYDLKVFLQDHLASNSYDVAVLTGNPFLHFFIIPYLKKKGIKVITDFRDPYAVNPRAVITSFSIKIKKYFIKAIEKFFIRTSDKVITVNSHCATLLTGFKQFKDKIEIIDNGYDERVFNTLERHEQQRKDNRVKFVYAGSLYDDRNPSVFLNNLMSFDSFSFHHVGSKSKFLENLNSVNIVEHGSRSYLDTLKIIADCDVCMIFTSGFPFESTTKIFDYIALEKIIWIVTEKEKETGALHEITKQYPNVIWSKNTLHDINLTLNEINKGVSVQEYKDKIKYSRARGLSKLVKLIQSL